MIVAVCAYTGSEALVEMTEKMVFVFRMQNPETPVILFNNKASRRAEVDDFVRTHVQSESNIGFGKAINHAIKVAELQCRGVSFILVLNNDLQFPQLDWLMQLDDQCDQSYITVPMTDNTANDRLISKGPKAQAPFYVAQASAYCWLVPIDLIQKIRRGFGFDLFDPDFFAYGEDDYTGAIARKLLGPRPFKVVPRSFVKHLRNQTGKELGLKGGMPANLKLLKKKLQANKLK